MHRFSLPVTRWLVSPLLPLLALLVLLATASCTVSTGTPEPAANPTDVPTTETAVATPTLAPQQTAVRSTPTNEATAIAVAPTPTAPPPPTAESPTAPPPTEAPAAEAPAPPPFWEPQIDQEAWQQAAVDAITELVNWADGNTAVIWSQMINWGELPEPSPVLNGGQTATIWAEAVDLDGDATTEIVLSAPLRSQECQDGNCRELITCFVGGCPGLVLIFEREDSSYVPAYRFSGGNNSVRLEHPRLFALEDLNNDGSLELVLSQDQCGAHTCSTSLIVGRWDGQQWHELGQMGQASTEITLTDRNDDGRREIVFHGGIVGSAGAGLQRPHTLVYGWRDGQYQLVEDIPDASDHPYFLMVDAHTALQNDNPDRALSLAQQAINQLQETDFDDPFTDEWAQPRIFAYAAIEAMLVHAQRQEPDAMQQLLNDIEAEANQPDNPYLTAARTLWDAYQESQDAAAACQAMADVVRANPEQAQFFQWMGYNTETIDLENSCPLSQS